jgi:transcriptional regulator with XRE-family HTH domain
MTVTSSRPSGSGFATGAPQPEPASVGELLRGWRQRRRLSQLDLANLSGVTTRHLSFVETGRSRPSREMVLHLAEHLDVPLRERNELLLAAGFAPAYRRTDLASPTFDSVRDAIDQVLAAHQPFPAIVIDRRWNLVSSNAVAFVLVEGIDGALLEPPANVLRIAVHPDGLAPRIGNLAHWSEHILTRLRRQAMLTGDPELDELYDELVSLLAESGVTPTPEPTESANLVATPMLLESRLGPLALITMIATFGTALDVTLAELSLETFLPADAATLATLNRYVRELG